MAEDMMINTRCEPGVKFLTVPKISHIDARSSSRLENNWIYQDAPRQGNHRILIYRHNNPGFWIVVNNVARLRKARTMHAMGINDRLHLDADQGMRWAHG